LSAGRLTPSTKVLVEKMVWISPLR